MLVLLKWKRGELELSGEPVSIALLAATGHSGPESRCGNLIILRMSFDCRIF